MRLGNKRFPDLVMASHDKSIAIQVGRRTAGGLAVPRERLALWDLRRSGTFDHVFFVGYD
jgi:hypothetical protein